ncbi:MAG: hypothetical protein COA74_09930 [Gammaproteobacteria bacterium]|nr:MAG: hypothetical protein COA74_09930 [Gammaproteobacteria bacterium]
MVKSRVLLSIFLLITGSIQADLQDDFWNKLVSLEGLSFSGNLTVGTEAGDKDFMAGEVIMHVWKVTETEIRIPFHIGENHSRTWVITRTKNGLRLKHDHRHKDGSDDDVTQYGGDTFAKGTPIRQEFAADKYTGELLTASAKNIWAMEVELGKRFVYELRREHQDRFFRVEFDLSKPVKTPVLAWGDK